jgi:hypothetical protein
MSTDWLDKRLLPSVDYAISDACRAIHEFASHVHLRHWHPISTAPYNQAVELRIGEGRAVLSLEFPCRRTNAGDWINIDLGTTIEIQPIAWRVWQYGP